MLIVVVGHKCPVAGRAGLQEEEDKHKMTLLMIKLCNLGSFLAFVQNRFFGFVKGSCNKVNMQCLKAVVKFYCFSYLFNCFTS